jgi:hypothetical protein
MDFGFGNFDVALIAEGFEIKEAQVNRDCLLVDVVEKFEGSHSILFSCVPLLVISLPLECKVNFHLQGSQVSTLYQIRDWLEATRLFTARRLFCVLIGWATDSVDCASAVFPFRIHFENQPRLPPCSHFLERNIGIVILVQMHRHYHISRLIL